MKLPTPPVFRVNVPPTAWEPGDEICPPLRRFGVYHYPYPLDEARMIALAPLFEGEHDFSAFAAADEKDALGHSKVRRIVKVACPNYFENKEGGP